METDGIPIVIRADADRIPIARPFSAGVGGVLIACSAVDKQVLLSACAAALIEAAPFSGDACARLVASDSDCCVVRSIDRTKHRVFKEEAVLDTKGVIVPRIPLQADVLEIRPLRGEWNLCVVTVPPQVEALDCSLRAGVHPAQRNRCLAACAVHSE